PLHLQPGLGRRRARQTSSISAPSPLPEGGRAHVRAIRQVVSIERLGLSPLQYQKQLRLQEARQLMLNQNLDAGSAAGRVGYESASQFSREYNRLFGSPPQRDIKRMRLI